MIKSLQPVLQCQKFTGDLKLKVPDFKTNILLNCEIMTTKVRWLYNGLTNKTGCLLVSPFPYQEFPFQLPTIRKFMRVKWRATIRIYQRLSCVDNNTISLAAVIQKVSYTDVSFTGLVSSCSNNSCLPCSLHTKRYRPETMIGSVTRIRSDLRLIMHSLIEWTLGLVGSRSMYPLPFNNNSLRLIERYRDSSSADYTELQMAMLHFVIIVAIWLVIISEWLPLSYGLFWFRWIESSVAGQLTGFESGGVTSHNIQ